MKLTDFLKDNKMETGNVLPEGDTLLDITECEINENPFTKEDGTKIMRYLIKFKDKSFSVPKSVIAKMQKESEKGYKKIRITRDGTDKNTVYVAKGIE